MSDGEIKVKLRSQRWFNDPNNQEMSALYLERYLNFGLTPEELRSGRPIIGIAQTGSDLSPCNRHHIDLAKRVRDGIISVGGVPIEFPVHPIQETGKRPTAALDRNLQYLSLVEVLHGYPIDGVVLTTGCDKTTPAMLMGAATVNIPAIALPGGPMLNGHHEGKRTGSGTVVWDARVKLAAGEIDIDKFIELVASSAQSVGHCNTMGTATSMNSLAEALGMTLTGGAAIPGPYRERGQMAYRTGLRIVDMVHENLRPSDVMTRDAFLNAIVTSSAIGGSSNCPIHLAAISRHMGVELSLDDWQTHGHDIPLLVNLQPAGEYLGEDYYRAGGVPKVMQELMDAGKLNNNAMTVTGQTMSENLEADRAAAPYVNRDVIRAYSQPMMAKAGFVVLSGNLFDSAVMKTSVIDDKFRGRYLSNPGDEDAFEARAIVFEGPEDYHARINDPSLEITAQSILVIRGNGPVGYPGSAEVVNMTPPDALAAEGIEDLACMGDGRQSGTSGSPSILNASPESAVGGGLAILETGDQVRVDLKKRTVNVMLSAEEIDKRKVTWKANFPGSQTPWEEIYRSMVGQLETGACLEPTTMFVNVIEERGESRDSH
ncbi:MAG: IlvD/Edd family dehydratase [Alphaproteobacteria bacterium]|jgi:dihydroxy-acid dehydratase|nr:dihydroxy-acid dehydratase [Rhodospirillaceae bacterium]MDP6020489.1 IlvD/Edd family dehydratase [Alphaproteobacteria bacterium]MDP6254233.1 IlvD/Edd family dehydratase [Alphaproteobacteria bacterium]MDP7052689.1 IlvD/Edd family dehydratase [Alphaproteobacteria bacterium]MDP7229807.1 IlvD/Edd family dehydratase [Alphaproteobacteria bacterium]|tara:strand:- start:4907 stop:6706 length:1800 start_codon:yes stop_codon:yes gene_type:complete